MNVCREEKSIVFHLPCRPHPYIFFNEDRATATFVGFTVTDDGDLLDPRTDIILEEGIVEEALRPTMKMLKFNENYQFWLVVMVHIFKVDADFRNTFPTCFAANQKPSTETGRLPRIGRFLPKMWEASSEEWKASSKKCWLCTYLSF